MNSTINTLLTFNQPIVRRLLQYKVPNDDEAQAEIQWSEKAVKSLVKKLKKSGGLQELENSIKGQGEYYIIEFQPSNIGIVSQL